MIIPENIEELATYVQSEDKTVFFFTADWCGDCRFIQPSLPEIEDLLHLFPRSDEVGEELVFPGDAYIDLAKRWDVYGIPSLVVLEKGHEIGRLVNRNRKTKSEINDFLASLN